MNRDRKLCDMTMALDRMGGNVVLLKEIIEMVRADIPGMLDRLRAAVVSKDSTAVEREAHSLAGTVVTFDAQGALYAAQRLQQMGRARDLSQATVAAEDLEREIALLDKALEAELQRH